MKNRKISSSIGLAFLGLAILASVSEALNYENVTGLLPQEPRDVNETIEAIVQDPVVKDAVQLAASNGSLNGLVVKRKTYIMPAIAPHQVLSQREQVLIVPAEHLEDVRKNITTDSREAEANESATVETFPSIENDPDRSIDQDIESRVAGIEEEAEFAEDRAASDEDDDDVSRGSLGPGERVFVPRIPPRRRPKTITVPVVAVVDPRNVRGDRVEASILAVLPNRPGDEALQTRVNYLDENRGEILRRAQKQVDQTSLAVDPESWNFVQTGAEEGDKHLEYPRDVEDMDVAEDMVFRPLFRYRQEAERRSRIREQDSYRGSSGYRRPYDPYRRYRHRPRYSDDYY